MLTMDFGEGLPRSGRFNCVLVVAHLTESIVIDQDRIFTSRFWKEMAALTRTKLRMSSSHHPQADGQSERVTQCLEAYLRCFTHACPVKWAQWLSLAEFWYNTSPHSALQWKSPFDVLYVQSPRTFGLSADDTCSEALILCLILILPPSRNSCRTGVFAI